MRITIKILDSSYEDDENVQQAIEEADVVILVDDLHAGGLVTKDPDGLIHRVPTDKELREAITIRAEEKNSDGLGSPDNIRAMEEVRDETGASGAALRSATTLAEDEEEGVGSSGPADPESDPTKQVDEKQVVFEALVEGGMSAEEATARVWPEVSEEQPEAGEGEDVQSDVPAEEVADGEEPPFMTPPPADDSSELPPPSEDPLTAEQVAEAEGNTPPAEASEPEQPSEDLVIDPTEHTVADVIEALSAKGVTEEQLGAVKRYEKYQGAERKTILEFELPEPLVIDPDENTVEDVLAALDAEGTTEQQVDAVKAAEAAGKGRVTITSFERER